MSLQVAQYAVLIVKYAKDQRYDEKGIATHCGQVLHPHTTQNCLTVLHPHNIHKYLAVQHILPGTSCRCCRQAGRAAGEGQVRAVLYTLSGTVYVHHCTSQAVGEGQ